MLGGSHVLVTDEAGIVEDIIPFTEAGEGVEKLTGILSPGFINCHCHLELSHMQGLVPEKKGLVDFLLSVIKQRNFSQDIIRQAIQDAERQMLKNGIVAVGDICNTNDTIPQKNKGNLYYHSFIETIGFPETIAAQRFKSSQEMYNQFTGQGTLPANSCSIVPHAPYSVSNKLFELIANNPDHKLLTIHNQESEEENIFFETGKSDFQRLYRSLGVDISFFKPSGKRSLETYLPYFNPNQSLILVHNVSTNEEDMKSIGSRQPAAGRIASLKPEPANLFFCLCPNANKYISDQLPDIDLFMKHNCKIVIGTDSLASNYQLSILEELKTIQKNFPGIDTGILLQWATSNGSDALQVTTTKGSFAKRKQPGIVLINNIENGRLTAKSMAERIL